MYLLIIPNINKIASTCTNHNKYIVTNKNVYLIYYKNKDFMLDAKIISMFGNRYSIRYVNITRLLLLFALLISFPIFIFLILL